MTDPEDELASALDAARKQQRLRAEQSYLIIGEYCACGGNGHYIIDGAYVPLDQIIPYLEEHTPKDALIPMQASLRITRTYDEQNPCPFCITTASSGTV